MSRTTMDILRLYKRRCITKDGAALALAFRGWTSPAQEILIEMVDSGELPGWRPRITQRQEAHVYPITRSVTMIGGNDR